VNGERIYPRHGRQVGDDSRKRTLQIVEWRKRAMFLKANNANLGESERCNERIDSFKRDRECMKINEETLERIREKGGL